MKETTKTSRTAGYLEKIFRTLNADSFGGELEEPIITIQSTPGAYGHISVHRTWQRKEDWKHELNISADWLKRPIEEVVATMLHEMVHLYNIQHDIQDCSRGGSYHNQKFRDEAEKHMLKISKHEKYGWTITEPTEALIDYIIKQGWEDIQTGRNPLFSTLGGVSGGKGKNGIEGKDKPTERKGNSRRYQCPKCKAIVRATKEVHIICGDCNIEFELS